jgi:RNA polymerase sigma factor (sigma-70 family)
MSSPGSVSRWILALKGGDASAAQPLWKRYYRQMVALARKMLRSTRRRAADEEDVVQNAFHSFFRAVTLGRFPRLDDRDSLRRLLVVITANKALRQLKHEHRQKRGGPTEAARSPAAIAEDESKLIQVADVEPTPDFAAQVADDYQRLLDMLGDGTLRQVAVWKMEGYANHEIASKLACSRRTVIRKLEAIRTLWSQQAGQASAGAAQSSS